MIDRRTALLAGVGAAGLAACASASPSSGQIVLEEGLTWDRFKDYLDGYACNVAMWFADLEFDARFDAAAALGFKTVEMWMVSSWNRDAKTLKSLCDKAGLSMAQIVVDAPALADPSTHAVWPDRVKTAIEEAQILGAPIITITGHQYVDGISESEALANYQRALEAVTPLFSDVQIYGAVEPFNPFDHPGHFINGHKEALRIVREIDNPFMGLNWDLFHMQRAEGNLITYLREGADKIVYMQLADSPDRHQPGTGEVNYALVIAEARKLGYKGPIGLEFVPKNGDANQARRDMVNLFPPKFSLNVEPSNE